MELKYIKHATIDKQDFRQFELEAVLRSDADARGIEPLVGIRQAMDPDAKAGETTDKDKKPTPVTNVVTPKGDD